MKEDFLVIDHNMLLRRLYLKCNLLYILQEYYLNKEKTKAIIDQDKIIIDKIIVGNNNIEDNKIKLSKILETNSELNNYLDDETNIKAEEIVLDINPDNNEKIDNEKIDTYIKNDKCKINTIVDKKKESIFSPRNDIFVEIEIEHEKDLEEDMDKKANKKCSEGCTTCYDGCNLLYTGISFVCSFVNHYMNKLVSNIKKCFD